MNINDFEKLTPVMQEVVSRKANDLHILLEDYLRETDRNFCIFLTPEIRLGSILAWDARYNYIVYSTTDAAEKDRKVNEQVISETYAIAILDHIARLDSIKNIIWWLKTSF